MGKEVIEKKLKVKGKLGMTEMEVLFDTGSSASLIRKDVAQKLTDVMVDLGIKLELTLGDGETKISSDKMTIIGFELNGYWLADTFWVIKELAYDVVIGVPTMQLWELKIDFEKKEIIVGRPPDKFYLV